MTVPKLKAVARHFLFGSMTTTTTLATNTAIAGLYYQANFANLARQEYLLDYIRVQQGWVADSGVYSRIRRAAQTGAERPKRRKLCFGGVYDPERRAIARRTGPLPPMLADLAKELFTMGLMSELADQVIVNEYLPGQGISAHADAKCFKDSIVSLSLGSACVMSFLRKKEGRRVDLILTPGSLLSMSGEARWRWTHEIAERKYDLVDGVRVPRATRYSITFRRMVDPE